MTRYLFKSYPNTLSVLEFIKQNLNSIQKIRYDIAPDNNREFNDILFAKECAYQEIIDFIENESVDEKSKPD